MCWARAPRNCAERLLAAIFFAASAAAAPVPQLAFHIGVIDRNTDCLPLAASAAEPVPRLLLDRHMGGDQATRTVQVAEALAAHAVLGSAAMQVAAEEHVLAWHGNAIPVVLSNARPQLPLSPAMANFPQSFAWITGGDASRALLLHTQMPGTVAALPWGGTLQLHAPHAVTDLLAQALRDEAAAWVVAVTSHTSALEVWVRHLASGDEVQRTYATGACSWLLFDWQQARSGSGAGDSTPTPAQAHSPANPAISYRQILDTDIGLAWPAGGQHPSSDPIVEFFLYPIDLWLLAESQYRLPLSERLLWQGVRFVTHSLRLPWHKVVEVHVASIGWLDRSSERLLSVAMPRSLADRLRQSDAYISATVAPTGLRNAFGAPATATTLPATAVAGSAVPPAVPTLPATTTWHALPLWRLDALLNRNGALYAMLLALVFALAIIGAYARTGVSGQRGAE